MKRTLLAVLVVGLVGCRSTAPVPVQQETSVRAKKPHCEPACAKDETCVVRKTYVVEEDGNSVEKEFLCFKTEDLVKHHVIK